jgi:hypothetical protein
MMNNADGNQSLRLKQERGWFAAGADFRRALGLLSDGAFRLFAWLCLEARWETGQIEVTYKELAARLGRSRRAVGRWAAELEAKAVCSVEHGRNQHDRTCFQISDEYWPYHGSERPPAVTQEAATGGYINKLGLPRTDDSDYVATIRGWFVDLECGKRTFSDSDEQCARQMQQRGVALRTIHGAILLGAARKYDSWLNGRPSSPISSLRYFEPVIEEIQQADLSDDYWRYLRRNFDQLAAAWGKSGSRDGLAPNSGRPARPERSRSSAGAQK